VGGGERSILLESELTALMKSARGGVGTLDDEWIEKKGGITWLTHGGKDRKKKKKGYP